MKTCVIMQPTYLPWLGYFDLIQSSDVFVFLDHVQFSKQSWQQRNRIRNKGGEIILTIPVKNSKNKENPIKDILIDHTRKPLQKHIKSIQQSYSKSKNFDRIFPLLEGVYAKKYEKLIDLNIDLIKLGSELINIESEFLFSSSLDVQGQKVDALVDICKKLDVVHYLSPVGSKDYIDENNIFDKNGIKLSYQNYSPPVYPQINYPNFISHLSFIDYLFNKIN